jgi:hypothetical protein
VSERTIASLIRSLESSDRHRCAEAAIRLGDGKAAAALPRLRELSEADDDVIALAAMYACWKLGDDRIRVTRVIDALASGDEERVQMAVHTACEIGQPMIAKLAPVLLESPERAKIALALLDDIHAPAARRVINELETVDPELAATQEKVLQLWDSDAEKG